MRSPAEGDEREIADQDERKRRYAETAHPGRGTKPLQP
jgi:hypothetical protein